MSETQNWAEALNINPESLSNWSAEVPEGTPLLVWCLMHGHVSVESYLQWAVNALETPRLESKFFSQNFDLKLIEETRALGDWRAWFFPVDKFDDVLVVACVEIPRHETADEFRYVLCDPVAMAAAYDGNVVSSESAPVDAPIGLSTAPAKPFVLNLDGDLFSEPTVVHAPPPVAPAAPVAPTPKMEEKPTLNPHADEPTRVTVPAPTPIKKAVPMKGSTPAAVKELIAKIGERFSGSIVMRVANQHAKIEHWDERLAVNSQSSELNVNLSFPTFLRIVGKTGMPYHGYLIESSAHREFFAALGLETLPHCVTALPVRNENQITAIVVAFGNELNQQMDSLQYAQDLVEKFNNAVGDEWLNAA